MAQNVVRVNYMVPNQVTALEVPRGTFQVAIGPVIHDQDGILKTEFLQNSRKRFGLDCLQIELLDDGHFLFLEFPRQRRAERAAEHFPG